MDAIYYDLGAALPEIFVLSMAMLILLLDLFLKPANRNLIYIFSQATLLGAAAITYFNHTPGVGYSFNGMFVSDTFSDLTKLMIYISISATLVYTRSYIALRGMFRGEFYALVLFSLLGMMILVSGQHFLTLYMGLELLSLSLYALVALDRDNPTATEAAIKYFVLGALASGMLLYGMSMIYGATGSLNLAEVSNALLGGAHYHAILVLGLVFIVAGLAFKLGAVPFQMWLPDVYQGAPTAVTILIGSATKIAAFAFVIRLLVQGLYVLAHDWQGMLVIMAVLSISIGSVTAIAQTNLKRMFAYSTIAHIGYLLYGLMSASINGYASAMLYIAAYALMSLGGFGMILLLSRKGFEAENLDDLKGLNQRNPWYAFLMLIMMFSMAGIPPTLGFYAKFAVLQAALQAGYLWVVVFGVLMATVGAYYYLRIVKLVYFDEPQDHSPIVASFDMKVILSLNGLALLYFGLMPQTLMDLCSKAILLSLQ
ncbi:NADH-quinone oxidoreductase subunit NuoN [Methyloradius palustris]|uniref:NADH-quinone oxidoreductase subunit N n=1 Tax=Methyloradius palustris TaxID=2778876 RepID=A0A8D5G9A9_9PROT|nr:NADH-quinone oxidoreductase subunit NuoN [Methyloradius palustris]BCM25507.1 NADH-quinone oxidoreductase subunit N [Methyloradius palustris]